MATWTEGEVYRVTAANLRMVRLLLAGLPATGFLVVGCGDDVQDGRGASGGLSAAGKGGGSTAGGTTGGSSSGGGGSASAGSGDSNGGRAVAGEGGATQGGSGGGDPGNIEYRACDPVMAINRILVYRIDEAAGTCAVIGLEESSPCNLGVEAGSWCLAVAQLSADMAACKMFMPPSDSKLASSASGTISVGSTVEIDVTLDFPAGGNLPTSVSVALSDCTPDCMQSDCRP